MKQKRALAFLLVCLMLFVQVPFTAFAADTEAITEVNADHLSPDTLKDGKVDNNYKQNLSFDWESANTGYQSYFWDIIDGALPPGLTLYPSGVTAQPWIEGTPTEAGTYNFTIRGCYNKYTNGQNKLIVDAVKAYTLTILSYPLEISSSNLLNGKAGSTYWSKIYEDGNRTVTWSMTLADGSALPEGLSINETSGEINWATPAAGKYNLKITATRGEESTSKVLKLIIEPEGGCTHADAVKTERKDATCKENGMADYWYCDTCEGYFLDAEGKRSTSSNRLDKLYTVGFHSDENGDDKCDTCGKAMPIFKKVTNEAEITSCGMYLVVSKIGDKYYTFKDLNNLGSIDAVEITKNSDGTFSYPKSDSDVMILKTGFAAECGELDAGQPRYGISTTIDGIPYTLTSDDYSGKIYMSSYGKTKYGYRMKLNADENAEIASVYARYWSTDESGKDEKSSILTAFEGKKDGELKRFFSLTTKDAYESEGVYTDYGDNYFYDTNSLSTYPIELYKLTYTEKIGENGSYTLSDAQTVVTIDSEVTVLNDFGSKKASTAGGISEAVKTSYVESVISGQTEIAGDVSVTTYAAINLADCESTKDEYDNTSISSLVYEITPKIEIKDTESEKTIVQNIDNKYLDGSEITLTLCVGNMNPTHRLFTTKRTAQRNIFIKKARALSRGKKRFQSILIMKKVIL